MAKIISTVLLSVILGYAICLGVHRHDAAKDFMHGREQGWNDQVALTSNCPDDLNSPVQPK